MTTLISGLAALVLAAILWAYLRVRVRHLQQGAAYLDDFSQLASQVAELEMPERDMRTLLALTHYVGTGHISSRIFRQMLNGDLTAPPTRDEVASWRSAWTGYHSHTRILYVRTFYSALRADSYFAGTVRGTMFRRLVFQLSADPAEIAKAVDAWETKILMLGAERAVEREAQRKIEPKQKELAAVSC